jgi:hypothetical protein
VNPGEAMPWTRRQWLSIALARGFAAAGGTPLAASLGRGTKGENHALLTHQQETEERIARVIGEYGQQGFHRTGTDIDRRSGDWLFEEIRRIGLTPNRESFSLRRVDVATSCLVVEDRRVEGLPLFDGAFTGEEGIRGRIGPLGSDAEIGLADLTPNTAGAGRVGEARRQGRHKALVCVTRGGRPGLCPSNADAFLAPFGPPVLQVSSDESALVAELAERRAEVRVIASAKRTQASAFNLTTRISGSDRTRPPLVVMTPRSGWYWCASERGGGIACWLELMRTLRSVRPVRDVVFVASSGHELGHLGIDEFVRQRPGIVPKSVGWMHFGANIGAAVRPARAAEAASDTSERRNATPVLGTGNTIQASDDELEAVLSRALIAENLAISRRNPRGTVPGGEAEVVHRGGGRYVSVIGSNALFHNPADRGQDVVDSRAIAAFTRVFAAVATTLIG